MIQPVTNVSAARIEKIPLLRDLPKRVVEYLIEQTCEEHLDAGWGIVSQGESVADIIYLIDGEALVSEASGNQSVCEVCGNSIAIPLNETDPAHATVVAQTDVELLRLPRELFEAIRRLPPDLHKRSSQPIELMDTSGPEASLYWEFHEAIQEGELELPTLPDIAIRIAKVINDANTDSRDIARVVQADPTVAARIISVVNSAAYRGKNPIDNLPDAVSRLGRNVTHHLVISFVLCKLFHSRSQILKQRMVQLWQHASYVAAICHELARVTPGLEPAQALLCGLLHDIGSLAIIGAVRSRPEISENPQLLDQVISSLKAEVGAMVLRKWEFPSFFVQAALHAEEWMEDISPSPDYLDLVVVAQLHSYIGTPHMKGLPRLDLVPAFHKLVLGRLTPRHSIGLLESAKERIRELREMLALH